MGMMVSSQRLRGFLRIAMAVSYGTSATLDVVIQMQQHRVQAVCVS